MLIMMSTCMMYLIIRYYLSVLGMGRGKPRVTRGVSALGTQPSKFGWVGYPTQKICGSPGRPMGFSPPHPLGLAAAERALNRPWSSPTVAENPGQLNRK